MSKFLHIIITIIFAFIRCYVGGFSCLDESGEPVDSWTAIKSPNNVTYYYYNAATALFELSPYTVNQTTQGAIMSTVMQLYSFPNDLPFVAYGAYNDEPPPPLNTASSTYAHAKGLLMTNESQGFWLVHSMPHWPNARYQGPAPFPDFTYGQSLMCVTINSGVSNLLASNLMIDRPYLYSENITASAAIDLPAFNDFVNKEHSSALSNVSAFPSYDGYTFYQFAKSKAWGEDIWDDLVAPYFHTPMYIETWRDGSGGRMSSICGPNASGIVDYDIYEIAEMEMENGVMWPGTKDHSKWGISAPNSSITAGIVQSGQQNGAVAACVGDMNRMCSQENRGGGALCTENGKLWSAFNATVYSLESCFEYYPCGGGGSQCYWCPTASPTISPTVYYSPTPTLLPTTDGGSNINSNGNNGNNELFGMQKDKMIAVICVASVAVLIAIAAIVYLLFFRSSTGNARFGSSFSSSQKPQIETRAISTTTTTQNPISSTNDC